MKKIIKEIGEGELTQENDEQGAGGFWDLAGEIALDVAIREVRKNKKISTSHAVFASDAGNLQSVLFHAFWDINGLSIKKEKERIYLQFSEFNRKNGTGNFLPLYLNEIHKIIN